MITFSQLGSLGRLGNQLFQYAALRSLGLKNGYDVAIPNPQLKNWHGQKCLLDSFNIEAKRLNSPPRVLCHYYEQNPFIVDKNFFSLKDNTNLTGFFQSMFYFSEYAKQIKKELTPKDYFLQQAKEEIQSYKDKFKCDIVSIHVRRGDNADNTDPGQVELNNFYCKQGSEKIDPTSKYFSYIEKAMSNFTNVKFLIFSGGNRKGNNNVTDIEWCKNSFIGDQFLFSENKTVMEDFSLIMSCDHNILSHVSSFGWWAAFLNKNPGLTIAPVNYHPDMSNYTHREQFYPSHWKLV